LCRVSENKSEKPFHYFSDNLPGRLKELLNQPFHPVCYSLGREDLEPVLRKMGGGWIPYGLVSRWGLSLPNPQEYSDKLMGLEAIQRLRGVQEWRIEPGLDFSSNEIMRYYARQHYESGHLFEKQGQEWLALSQYDAGTRFYGEAFAFNDMAVILGKMKYFPIARRLCALGIWDSPLYQPDYVNLAQCYMEEGDYAEASKVYKKIIELTGPSAEWQKKLETAQVLSRSVKKTLIKSQWFDRNKILESRFRRDGMFFLGLIARTTVLWEKNVSKSGVEALWDKNPVQSP
jgi:tetratricopeptide (TPR) repeat protein